jgi:hypothetical protein
VSFSDLVMSIILASWNDFGSVPSIFISWKSLRIIGVSSSLKVWQNSMENTLGHGLFWETLYCCVDYSVCYRSA